MSPKRRLSRSAAVLLAALATVVGATAVTLTATPSSAAASRSNGYVALACRTP